MKRLRVFLAIHNTDWEKPNLVWTMQDMFDVVWFDWATHGYSQYSADWPVKKQEMNKLLVDTFIKENAKKKFDLFFGYLSDPVVDSWVIDAIRSTGVYTMNFGCNNVGSFVRANKNIGKHFDVTWTVDKVSVEKFEKEGMPVIYAPLAVNSNFYIANFDAPQLFDVGLIGRLYGYRMELLNYLKENGGFSIHMASGIKYETMFPLVHSTAINIIPRGIGNATIDNEHLKQIRLRDFEVTAMGGLSVSEDYPDLHDLFEVGEEVITYPATDLKALVEVCKEYTKDKAKRDKVRKAGHKRVINEHTWGKRFAYVLKEVGVL